MGRSMPSECHHGRTLDWGDFEAHRLYDVVVCAVCDVRFWTHKTQLGRGGLRCPTCRVEDAA